MDYGYYTSLKVEKRDRIAFVTVDRPDIENQIDEGMHRELEKIWRDLAADKESMWYSSPASARISSAPPTCPG